MGFDDPNWLLILVWASPQTGLTVRSFFGRRSRKHQQRSEALRLGKEGSQLIKLVTTAGNWGSDAQVTLGDSGEHLPGSWGIYSPTPIHQMSRAAPGRCVNSLALPASPARGPSALLRLRKKKPEGNPQVFSVSSLRSIGKTLCYGNNLQATEESARSVP